MYQFRLIVFDRTREKSYKLLAFHCSLLEFLLVLHDFCIQEPGIAAQLYCSEKVRIFLKKIGGVA